jgi:rhodanese-related sulfurtransferase
VVIDVRTPEEYAAGHVPGAVNVPLDQLGPSHAAIASLDRAQPVYFICQVGGRSQRAADLMAEAGYQARNVLGGTGAWVQAGKAVE